MRRTIEGVRAATAAASSGNGAGGGSDIAERAAEAAASAKLRAEAKADASMRSALKFLRVSVEEEWRDAHKAAHDAGTAEVEEALAEVESEYGIGALELGYIRRVLGDEDGRAEAAAGADSAAAVGGRSGSRSGGHSVDIICLSTKVSDEADTDREVDATAAQYADAARATPARAAANGRQLPDAQLRRSQGPGDARWPARDQRRGTSGRAGMAAADALGGSFCS